MLEMLKDEGARMFCKKSVEEDAINDLLTDVNRWDWSERITLEPGHFESRIALADDSAPGED
eukprot:308914-Karenia_brevis.AAC.1